MGGEPDRHVGTTAKGLAWVYSSLVVVRLLGIVQVAILARLLEPEVVGIVMTALLVITFLETVSDFGMGLALVRQESNVRESALAAFGFGVGLGAVWFSVMFFGAETIAGFFDEPRAAPILRALAFVHPIKALGTAHDALMMHGLSFGRASVPEVVRAVVRAGVAIALAFAGLEEWALVWGHLAGTATLVTCQWIAVPWRPWHVLDAASLRLARDAVRPMLRFGREVVAINVISALMHHVDQVLVARLAGSTAMGLYSWASKLPESCITTLTWALGRVGFASFARVDSDAAARQRLMRVALRLVALATLPAATGLALLAEEAVLIGLGRDWMAAAPILVWLALTAAFRAVGTPSGAMFKGSGRPEILRNLALLKASLTVPSLIAVGVLTGSAVAIAATFAAVTLVTSALNVEIARRLVDLRARDVVRDLMPSLAASAAVAAVVMPLGLLTHGWPVLADAALRVASGVAAAAIVAWWTTPEVRRLVASVAARLRSRSSAALGLGLLALAAIPAARVANAQERVLVEDTATWRWLPGLEPFPAGWQSEDFDDTGWAEATAPLGYGDGDDATLLEDMPERYVSVALRVRFDVAADDVDRPLRLSVLHDDGFVAWLDGREVARRGVAGDPPAHDALAEDHEARAPSVFALPAGTLRVGQNVLAIQAHNALPGSSDFTIAARLELASPPTGAADGAPPRSGEEAALEPPPAPRVEIPAGRVRWFTTLASWHVTNQFQGREGTPKEGLTGQEIRQEARLVLRRSSPLALRLRVDLRRHGTLGEGAAAFARATWSPPPVEVQVDAWGQWGRPAFRLAGGLVKTDSAGTEVTLTRPLGDRSLALAGWAGFHADWPGRSRDRSGREITLGGSVRLLRHLRAISPEVGLEAVRRSARSDVHSHDERRLFVQLRGSVTRRLYLTGLLRWGERDYEDATGSPNRGREDRRRLARLTATVRAAPRLEINAVAWYEDGATSRDPPSSTDGPFDSVTLWTGLTWAWTPARSSE